TGISSFKNHKNLRELILGDNVTDEGLKNIAELKNLRFLGIYTHPLNLEGTQRFTDRGLAALEGLNKLEELHLPFAGITDEALKSIGNLPKLNRLNLSFVQISGEGFKHLEKCHHLESLTIGPVPDTKMTAQGAANLAKLKHLKFLYLWGPTDAQLKAALHSKNHRSEDPPILSHLKSLMLIGADRITDEGIGHLSQLENLEYMFVDAPQVGDRSVESLSTLTHLKVLHMDDTSVTDQAIAKFGRFEALD
ncbi:MAG: hypothetical protein KDA84_19750, partial [Planctomycetaceae bacterium]|nr:hypothetical protein [Planctomycetaceae bacterium]